MSTLRVLALLAAALFFAQAPARADVAVPPLRAHVTDLTGTLSADQSAALERELVAFEQSKGSQIGVLILPTTQPETIEQYGIRVGEAWKLGRKGIDDGAVLIVARDDHRLRIEVGYGLEGALNDATSKRIIDEIIVPRFKQGQFYEGVEAGVQGMLKVVAGEPLPPPKAGARLAARDEGGRGFWIILVIVGAYMGSTILRTMFGRPLGAAFTAAGVGAAVWFASGLLLLALLCAGVGFVVALLGGLFSGIGPGGGFGGSSFGGSSFGGGGFSGGGFSGGGGSFGGGGASGSW